MKKKEIPPEVMRQEMIKLVDDVLNRISFSSENKRFLSAFINAFQEWEEKQSRV